MIVSANGIVFNEYSDVLLVQRDDTRTLAPPGGACEIDELPHHAAAREVQEETGGRLLAIPHNGNVSNGQMFPITRLDGSPIDRAYAETRMRWEPLYEVTQMKGDGEAHGAS